MDNSNNNWRNSLTLKINCKKLLFSLLILWAIFLVADSVTTVFCLNTHKIIETNVLASSYMHHYGIIRGLIIFDGYVFASQSLLVLLPFVTTFLFFYIIKKDSTLEVDSLNFNRTKTKALNISWLFGVPYLLYLCEQNLVEGAINNVGVIMKVGGL